MLHRLFLAACLVTPLVAQDGGQLYTLYCAACHGTDGKGATGGTFPPLAESPWVASDPDRSIKLVLHGLSGPVEVLGKTYNLEMPPQGAVLPDDSIAAILSYVRSSWGNDAPPVPAARVAKVRAETADRTTSWTAAEILKLHPFPLEKTVLTDLISQVFPGKRTVLPDFSKANAANAEEEHDGIISLTDSPHKDNFAMVWEGNFQAPADGNYTFFLDADDAARVLIGGKQVVQVRGSGPINASRGKEGKVKLTRGAQKLRVEYLEIVGQQGISLGWKGPGVKNWRWLTDSVGSPTVIPPIPIEPVDGRPVIHRDFIAGVSPRAIGVGFPGGVNLAWSADVLGPVFIWTGKFIDGSKKWVDRGLEPSPPAGENVVTLATSKTLPAEARFRGYKLDPAGNPTFAIQIGDRILQDAWRAETGTLIRTLSVTGSPLDVPLSGQPEIQGATVADGMVKVLPSQPVTLTYRWK